MKPTLLIISLIVVANTSVWGQNIHTGIYRTSKGAVEKYSPQIDTLKNEPVTIRAGIKLDVIGLSPDGQTVYYTYIPFRKTYEKFDRKFLFWKKNIEVVESKLAKEYNDKVFKMNTLNFIEYTTPITPYYKGAKIGVYTVPFRLRDIGGEYFDFESSLSLQSNIIFGFGTRRSTRSWIDLSAGIGLTGVSITPLNSNLTESQDSRTASAFTWSVGAVFNPQKNVSLGIFIGADYLGLSDSSIGWVYNKKGWLGLGLNINFNEIQSDKSPRKIDKNQDVSR